LSSAILYGAIVVIWAGVLIPRWLRRESSYEGAPEVSTPSSDTSDSSDSSGPLASPALDADPGTAAEPDVSPRRRMRADAGTRAPVPVPAPGSIPAPVRRDPEHARVVAARRRLLGMLVLLAIGAGVLAVMQLAALWVVLPT
jgi:hypothetical protein